MRDLVLPERIHGCREQGGGLCTKVDLGLTSRNAKDREGGGNAFFFFQAMQPEGFENNALEATGLQIRTI